MSFSSSSNYPNAALKKKKKNYSSLRREKAFQHHLLSPSFAGGALLAWIVASRLSKRRDISSTVVLESAIRSVYDCGPPKKGKEGFQRHGGIAVHFPTSSADTLLNLVCSWARRSSTTVTSSEGAVPEGWS